MTILKRIFVGLGALAALAAVAGVGYYVASLQDDNASTLAADGELDGESDPAAPTADETTTTTEAATTTSTIADDQGDDSDSTADADGDPAETDAETDAGGEDTAETTAESTEPVDDGRPEGYEGDAPFAIFDGGILSLYGKVPDQATYDLYEERFGRIVGPENVDNRYTIDAGFTIEEGQETPVYVTDAVLFDFNSIEIKPEHVNLLEYGALMLSQNPQATLTVVTYTDATGSEEVNQRVSELRADAVLNYWDRRGVNPDQVFAEARGETGASETDDETMAAQQRRAEFIIKGLLD